MGSGGVPSLSTLAVTAPSYDRAPLAIRAGITGSVGVQVQAIDGRPVIRVQTGAGPRRGALAQRDGAGLQVAARLARQLKVPLVLELASSGADVTEGIEALHGWGGAAAAVAACSGEVPVLGVATGPVISGPALLLGLCDLVVMSPAAVAFVSGPAMVSAFTGVRVGSAELGGATVHARVSGLCTVEAEDVEAVVAELLDYLPAHTDALAQRQPSDDPLDRATPELAEIVPVRDTASYDVRDVVASLVDDGHQVELWAQWAPQIVTGFARLDGHAVGVVANQPRALAGTLDIAASQKAARFVRQCDAFNLPILTLIDTPGFLPGKDLEWRGMIRHGAELAFAYAEATVPRVALIMRKAFGGAYIVMDSKGLGNDVCLAWPGAEIAVMGAPGAVQILHRRATLVERAHLEEDYRQRYLTPWEAADRGFVDAVVDPGETRAAITGALSLLVSKREGLIGRKHDAGPL